MSQIYESGEVHGLIVRVVRLENLPTARTVEVKLEVKPQSSRQSPSSGESGESGDGERLAAGGSEEPGDDGAAMGGSGGTAEDASAVAAADDAAVAQEITEGVSVEKTEVEQLEGEEGNATGTVDSQNVSDADPASRGDVIVEQGRRDAYVTMVARSYALVQLCWTAESRLRVGRAADVVKPCAHDAAIRVCAWIKAGGKSPSSARGMLGTLVVDADIVKRDSFFLVLRCGR